MANQLTKEQATRLLEDYESRLRAAMQEAIDAYDRKLQSELAAEEEDNRRRQQQQRESAKAEYNANAVKALAQQRQLKEQLARRGLTNSGTAAARRTAIADSTRATERQIAGKQAQALGTLQEQLLTARRKAEQSSKVNAANARKTLENKVAEKRITLMKGVSG